MIIYGKNTVLLICITSVAEWGERPQASVHLATRIITLVPFLGAFAKLRKATVNCLSARPYVYPPTWNNAAPTRPIFIEFDEYTLKMCEKIQFALQSDKNNEYFA